MKKFIIFFLIIILSFYILSEFIGDRIIKGALENNLSNVLDRDINIDTLKINYLSGDAEIKGLKIVVIEKAEYLTWQDMEGTEEHGFNNMYEKGGVLITEDTGIAVLAGSAFGGGTASPGDANAMCDGSGGTKSKETHAKQQ